MNFFSKFLAEISSTVNDIERQTKLEEYADLMKEELRKIEVFKRELPLCLILLTEAIEAIEEVIRYNPPGIKAPVLEEFIPTSLHFNLPGLGEKKADCDEKINWMSSAQLWSNNPITVTEERNMKSSDFKETFLQQNRSSKQFKVIQSPFSKNRRSVKKSRRCWSPELHQRFLNALQDLGGSQAVTPKQIRQLMKVDGLTNDEVKSHLQKYRLREGKNLPSVSHPANQALLRGEEIWVPQKSPQFDGLNKFQMKSNSPKGPLQSGDARAISAKSVEEEDGKSECHSWRGYL